MRMRAMFLGRAFLAGLTLLLAGCEMALTRAAPYGTVRVQANSRSGVPLPGIEALLYTGRRPMGYGTTDAAGLVVFRNVPPGNYGVYMTLPPNYADLSELLAVPPGTVQAGFTIDDGRDTTLTFTFMRRGLGSIEARTRDSTGAPLAGIAVTFYRSSGPIGNAITDAAGIARLDSVPSGGYGASLVTPDTLGVPPAFRFRDGLVVDADIVPRAEFTLATCRGSIAVSVRDQFDAPIAGIDVLRFAQIGVNKLGSTDANGSVSFSPVWCGGHGVALQALSGFTVKFERDSGYVDFTMTRGSTVNATLRATRN